MDLIPKQEKLAELILNFWETNQKIIEQSTSEGSIRSCLEVLKEYWKTFKNRQEQIIDL